MELKLALVLTLCFAWAQSLSVSTSIQGGNFDEKSPLVEEDDVTLICQTDEEYSTCMWTHEIDDQYGSDGQQLMIECSTSGGQHSAQCENNGGSDELDEHAPRMTIMSTGNSCNLRIESHNIDDGKWYCSVSNPRNQAVRGDLDLHVSNQSKVIITDPDLWQDPHAVIEYQIDDSRAEIEATCTAYGGKPVPEFHWYIEDGSDDRNEITPDNVRNRESNDDLGDYIQQTMTWQPTRSDLCDFDEINNICDDFDFSFNLVCKVVQSSGSKTYYERENDEESTDQIVLVDVKGGQGTILSSICLLLFTFFVSTRL